MATTVECKMPMQLHGTAAVCSRARAVAPFIFACLLGPLGPQYALAQSSADDIRAQMDAIYARVQTLRLSYDKKDQLKADGMMRDYDRLKNRLELEIRAQGRSTKVTTQQRVAPNAQSGANPSPTTSPLAAADAQHHDNTDASIRKCMDAIRLPNDCTAFMTTDCINANVREKRRCDAIGLAPATSN